MAKHSSRFVSAAPCRALCFLRDLPVLWDEVVHGGLPLAVALDLPFLHELRLGHIGCVDARDKVGCLFVVGDVELIFLALRLRWSSSRGNSLRCMPGESLNGARNAAFTATFYLLRTMTHVWIWSNIE